MTTAEAFRDRIKNGNRSPYLWHFTDGRNLQNIAQHGLLSRARLNELNVPAVLGGNDWSQTQDDRLSRGDYVHLSFFDDHPMAYLAEKDGRIENVAYLGVNPDVVLLPGVRICRGVANATGSVLHDPSQFSTVLDEEVLFSRTDWKDEAIKARLREAKKSEILVPTRVALEYIVGKKK